MGKVIDRSSDGKEHHKDVMNSLKPGERFCEIRCTVGGHYKTYILMVTEEGGEWLTTAFWGKIGARVQSQVKFRGRSGEIAVRELEKWKRKKMIPHGSDGNKYVEFADFTYADILGNKVPLSMVEALEVQVESFSRIVKGEKAQFVQDGENTYVSFLEV